MSITGLYMENIRCFHGKHYVPLKPLTILVGENSTGKTTILGTLSAFVKGDIRDWVTLDFNEPPFLFGGFGDITSDFNKDESQREGFIVGVDYGVNDYSYYGHNFKISFLYANKEGKPFFDALTYLFKSVCLNLRRLGIDEWELFIKEDNGDNQSNISIFLNPFTDVKEDDGIILGWSVDDEVFSDPATGINQPLSQILDLNKDDPLIDGILPFRFPGRQPGNAKSKGLYSDIINIAPIRALPETTYESYKEKQTPQGHHVPYVLERFHRKGQRTELFDAIDEFGKASGLYSTVDFKRFGEPDGSRFELTIEIGGPARNFAYVGVGVAQVLPVLTDAILAPEKSLITLQQPEVHLHPRAQAELGSLFVQLVKHDKKQIIVETHSDYIVDRIRQEIGNGVISNEDVQILFTELDGSKAVIKEVELNERGDIIDPPNNYRKFFMEEELSLLRRGD